MSVSGLLLKFRAMWSSENVLLLGLILLFVLVLKLVAMFFSGMASSPVTTNTPQQTMQNGFAALRSLMTELPSGRGRSSYLESRSETTP